MNLIEYYVEKRKGIPVTHKKYPLSKEIHEAALVMVRFSDTPGESLYFISKFRFGFNDIVLDEKRALNIIDEIKRMYKYVLIDAKILPKTEYFSVRSRVIKYLNPEPCGMPKTDDWW